MAEAFSFKIITTEFDKMMTDARRSANKTTMYGLRQVGREVVKVAKAAAPVYKGDDPRVFPGDLKKSIRPGRHIAHVGDNFILRVGPEGSSTKGTKVIRYSKGDTREDLVAYRSYMTSKGKQGKVSAERGDNSTKGMVRGVNLYRAKMEERWRYMAKGYAVAETEASRLVNEAFEKAYERYK